MIYFLLAPKAKAVKIGYSKDVDSRIRTLQTGNHETLQLLGTIEGTMQLERLIHDELKRYRVIGEWFDFKRPIRAFVETCISTGDWVKARTVWTLPDVARRPSDKHDEAPKPSVHSEQPTGSEEYRDYFGWALKSGLSIRQIERDLRSSHGLSQSRAKHLISALKADWISYENFP